MIFRQEELAQIKKDEEAKSKRMAELENLRQIKPDSNRVSVTELQLALYKTNVF